MTRSNMRAVARPPRGTRRAGDSDRDRPEGSWPAGRDPWPTVDRNASPWADRIQSQAAATSWPRAILGI